MGCMSLSFLVRAVLGPFQLFTDSISPKCRFTAFPCDSYEKFETGQCFQCNSEVSLMTLDNGNSKDCSRLIILGHAAAG